jgi:hypothetical protein
VEPTWNLPKCHIALLVCAFWRSVPGSLFHVSKLPRVEVIMFMCCYFSCGVLSLLPRMWCREWPHTDRLYLVPRYAHAGRCLIIYFIYLFVVYLTTSTAHNIRIASHDYRIINWKGCSTKWQLHNLKYYASDCLGLYKPTKNVTTVRFRAMVWTCYLPNTTEMPVNASGMLSGLNYQLSLEVYRTLLQWIFWNAKIEDMEGYY